jgi:hypothetical protein
MKIRVKKVFRYQVSASEVGEIQPGIHDLPTDLAQKVLRFGKAEIIMSRPVEKKAPENKVVKVADNKSKVAGKAKRRRSARSKPNK